jgi:hypothetical protein
MRTHIRAFLTALTATLTLATTITTATATANRLSISNTSFRTVWSALSFASGAEAESVSLACSLTLEGSFHYQTTAKRLGALIGYVTKAVMGHPCSGSGEAWAHNGTEEAGLGIRFANSLPWHLTYEGFEGRLPEITGIRILARPRYTVRAPIAGLCGYEGYAEGIVKLGRGGVVIGQVPDPNVGMVKISGGLFCPGSGSFTASLENSTVTLLGNTQTITIRLI